MGWKTSLILLLCLAVLWLSCGKRQPTDYFMGLNYVDSEFLMTEQDSASRHMYSYAIDELSDSTFVFVQKSEFARQDTAVVSFSALYFHENQPYFIRESANFNTELGVCDFHEEKDTIWWHEEKVYIIGGSSIKVHKATSTDWKMPACRSVFVTKEFGLIASRGNSGRYLSFPLNSNGTEEALLTELLNDRAFLFCGEELEQYEKRDSLKKQRHSEIQHVLERNVVDSLHIFGEWTKNDGSEARVRYLGTIKSENKIFKIVNTTVYWGLSKRASSSILIFNEANTYLGCYPLEMIQQLPARISNNRLLFENNNSKNCDPKSSTELVFQKGIPEEFFLECADGFGQMIFFDFEQ